MQIFSLFQRKSISKRFLTVAACVILGSNFSFVYCQKMPEMPDFPEITPPSIGNGFYTPKVPYYPKVKDSKSPSEQKEENSPNEKTLSDSRTTTELLSSLMNGNDILTAQDITSLSNTNSFSTLSSLIGNGYNSDTLTNNSILQQILQSLEELKNERKPQTDDDEKKASLVSHQPSVLRFKINNYDIKDSLTTVYISRMENDGSFLMTADRRYIADKKVRNETFYLLFKTKENTGSVITYEVTPSVMQDSENQNSFIYKLCSQKNLKAQKTGNLVVLRTSSKDCDSDLLIDLDI